MDKVYVYLPAGSVEYAAEDAEMDINELIERLEMLRDDGATHIVGLSGNYTGAQYTSLGTPDFDEE